MGCRPVSGASDGHTPSETPHGRLNQPTSKEMPRPGAGSALPGRISAQKKQQQQPVFSKSVLRLQPTGAPLRTLPAVQRKSSSSPPPPAGAGAGASEPSIASSLLLLPSACIKCWPALILGCGLRADSSAERALNAQEWPLPAGAAGFLDVCQRVADHSQGRDLPITPNVGQHRAGALGTLAQHGTWCARIAGCSPAPRRPRTSR